MWAKGKEVDGLIIVASASNVSWEVTGDSTWALFTRTVRELLTGSYSMLHAHGVTAAIVSVWLARMRGVPTLLTVHEVFTAGQFSGRGGLAKRIIVGAILRSCSVVHAVTHDAANNIAQYVPGLERRAGHIRIISHGVDVQRFRNGEVRNLRQECLLPESCFLFGFFSFFLFLLFLEG